MPDFDSEERTPLLQEFHPQLRHPTFSIKWTILAMSAQVSLCGLIWAFAGAMIINKVIPLPDNLAYWIHRNPSETNMLITSISTALGITVSFLSGLTIRHALRSRLSHEIQLSTVMVWIQLARRSRFLQFGRHPWWTIRSVFWVATVHFLTTAWSNLLMPEMVTQRFEGTGQELDLLSPAASNLIQSHSTLIPPASQRYSLTPESVHIGEMTTISQAGLSAALNTSFPTFVNVPGIGVFNSSTGGVLPTASNISQVDWASLKCGLRKNHRGLSTTYTFVQQGCTANISCMISSSPTITLNNTASVRKTFETPSGPVIHTREMWSWGTNCSASAEYYAGEVDIWGDADGSPIGTGLFAVSVCLFQDFSGPSNQSLLVLMRPTNNSHYLDHYSRGDPDMLTICQVTPTVTTVEVHLSESGTLNVNDVGQQGQFPNDSWPFISSLGLEIWMHYFVAQGPYTNSMADDVLTDGGDTMSVLEEYLRGVIELISTAMRSRIIDFQTQSGQPLPDNMIIPFTGTMNVHTMGWRFHQRTHCIGLAVITLITIITAAFGVFALRMEANSQRAVRDRHQKRSTIAFKPTSVMDVLMVSSGGNLMDVLSQCESKEEAESLRVRLAVTEENRLVLNAR